MEKVATYTVKKDGLITRIETPVIVLRNDGERKPSHNKQWKAMWDTGSTLSGITQEIVDLLGLTPIKKLTAHTSNGSVLVDVYKVSLVLPNNIMVGNVAVSCNNMDDDIDVLIGMNVIRLGDFALTNKDRKSTFSFRVPSIEEIDFQKIE